MTMKKWMKHSLVLLGLMSSHVVWSDDTWFSIFNVSANDIPGSYYAYSISSPNGGTCTSTCPITPFQEATDGTSNVPLSCQINNCPTTLTIYLKGQMAGTSCQNIDLTGISEVWVYYNQDRFTANCQPYYLSQAVQSAVASQLAAINQAAGATDSNAAVPGAPGASGTAAPGTATVPAAGTPGVAGASGTAALPAGIAPQPTIAASPAAAAPSPAGIAPQPIIVPQPAGQ